MQIVIDIDERRFKDILRISTVQLKGRTPTLEQVIAKGIPLPKGHGDLISKEQAIELVEFYQLNPQHFDFVNLIDEIKDEKPIIEADKVGEEE